MAGKMNVMKLLQELRGLADFANRRPSSKLPGFPLAPWRAFSARGASARRKRTIRIAIETPTDIPHPVKITHLKNTAAPAPGSQPG